MEIISEFLRNNWYHNNVGRGKCFYVLKKGGVVMKLASIALIAATAFAVSGCTTSEKKVAGTLVGAAGGAAIGSAFGSGTGQVVGAAVGAGAGALLGHEVGKRM